MAEALRREIAGHLHETLQNKLLLMLYRIDEMLKMGTPGPLALELGQTRDLLEQVIEKEVRQFSTGVYPGILRRGLIAGLQSLGDRCRQAVAVEMDIDQGLERAEKVDSDVIGAETQLSAYRIAEEALANVVRHAAAGKVLVALDLSPRDQLRLVITDDGRGFDVAAKSDMVGIGTMKDYAEVVGGECVVASAEGNGTKITATLPLNGDRGGRLEGP